jgi:hypothetical protein
MRKIVLITVLAVAGVPAGALAAKPSHPATPASTNANSNANPTSTTGSSSKANAKSQSAKVMFVIHGTLGTYVAASGATNGSIQVMVKSSNHESALLKAALPQPLTIPVSSNTKITGTLTSGHDGIVKIRAAKNASVATLLGLTAFQVIDQGASA